MGDALTGRLLVFRLPTWQASGDTISSWITTLHIAFLWGVPFRIVITLAGLAVALLSVTGILIWWKKRRAQHGRALARQQSPSALLDGATV